MLAIYFNHTRQLFITEMEKKRDKLCWVSSFRKKLKEKLFPFAWAAHFLSRCLHLSAAKGRTMWFTDFLIEVVHGCCSFGSQWQNSHCLLERKLGLSMAREKYSINLGDPDKGSLTSVGPCSGSCPLVCHWFLYSCRSCGFICLFSEPEILPKWFYC